jgi:hypothetical protein
METDQFDKNEVLSVMGAAGKMCSRKIAVYMVGGGAMAIRGEKAATKDVDLILESEEDAKELSEAFKGLDFEVNSRHPVECKELVDAEIMTTMNEMRVDIFVRTVCHKLFFSEGMKGRSELVGEMGHISLNICSREDIFLLKSVTERNRDLDDMVVLYRKGIDKDTLIGECQTQDLLDSQVGGRIWEAFLSTKIEEMEERFGISIPWKGELKRIADLKLGCTLVVKQIRAGSHTVNAISAELGIRPTDIRKYLTTLEHQGLVVLDRSKRPNQISLT